MKFLRTYTLQEIADLIGSPYKGEPDFQVSGLNEIHMVESGDLTFVNVEKYYKKALNSAATTILIDKEVECPPGKSLIISNDPFRDYNFLAKYFRPVPVPVEGAYRIGENSVIGSGSVVTKDIPKNVFAAGNPCKVIREISEEDRLSYQKNFS